MDTRRDGRELTKCGGKALDALFPGPRRRILAALFGDPNRWWSVPDLAGRAGLRPGSLRPHITPMRESGLLREKQENGRSLLQPDPACPVFAELHAIVSKLTANGAETILIVEDQPATAQITRILLESWGYQVLEAHSSREAIRLFEEHGGQIELLLTDVMLPDIKGPDLAVELVARSPRLRVILMSGHALEDPDQSGTAFLPKPFNPASLSRIVRKELDRPNAAAGRMNFSLD